MEQGVMKMEIDYEVRFESFEDLFFYICREIERMEGWGEEPEGIMDDGFNEWMKESISDETKEEMLHGSLSGLSPAVYAEVLDDSFTYTQAYPKTDFGEVFRWRLEQRVQIEGMIKLKGWSEGAGRMETPR